MRRPDDEPQQRVDALGLLRGLDRDPVDGEGHGHRRAADDDREDRAAERCGGTSARARNYQLKPGTRGATEGGLTSPRAAPPPPGKVIAMDIRTLQKPLKDGLPRGSRALADHPDRQRRAGHRPPVTCSVEVGRAIHAAEAHAGVGRPRRERPARATCCWARSRPAPRSPARWWPPRWRCRSSAIGVTVEGDLDLQGTLGTRRDVPVGFEEIRVRFDSTRRTPTPTPSRALAEKTERYCVVMQTLTAPPVSRRVGPDGTRRSSFPAAIPAGGGAAGPHQAPARGLMASRRAAEARRRLDACRPWSRRRGWRPTGPDGPRAPERRRGRRGPRPRPAALATPGVLEEQRRRRPARRCGPRPPTEAVRPRTVPCSRSPAASEMRAVVVEKTSPEATASSASPTSRSHRLSATATSEQPHRGRPPARRSSRGVSPRRSTSRPTSTPCDDARPAPR